MEISRSDIRSIGIFRALQLGDILCAIPAIREIRRNFPHAIISFIGLPHTEALLARFPHYVDRFIEFPGYHGLPEQEVDEGKLQNFIAEQQQHPFDLLFQLQGNGTIVNAFLQSLHPKILTGFYPAATAEKPNPFMLEYPDDGHESTRHLRLLTHLGLTVENTAMEFTIWPADLEGLNRLNLDLQQPYVCIHPGSRGSWRQWPTSYFASLADDCVTSGLQVVFTGTANEQQIVAIVQQQMHFKSTNLAGRTNLGSLAALLKKSRGLIANCTGVSHVAAGLRVPSVIISMDGEPERWAPMDKYIHQTIDWTQNHDYEKVRRIVKSHLLDPTTSQIPQQR